MLRQKQKRDETAKESAEPSEPKPAVQQRRIGHQLSRDLQNVIEARSHQTRESGDANDEKPFVVMARLAAFQVAALHELLAAAVKICLQDIRGGQKASGHHEAEGRNCQRPKM